MSRTRVARFGLGAAVAALIALAGGQGARAQDWQADDGQDHVDPDDEYATQRVGEWEVTTQRENVTTDFEGTPYVAMRRSAGRTNYDYSAHPGNERRIGIQREGCADETYEAIAEETGGTGMRFIWATGTRDENLAASRAAIRAFSARWDERCPAPAEEIDQALGDFDNAFAVLEARIAANPFPDALAWSSGGGGGMFTGRTESRVRINYWPSDRLLVDVDGCAGEDERNFEALIPRNLGQSAFIAEAVTALRGLLREAQAQCGLDAGAPGRLERGFAEAMAQEYENYAR